MCSQLSFCKRMHLRTHTCTLYCIRIRAPIIWDMDSLTYTYDIHTYTKEQIWNTPLDIHLFLLTHITELQLLVRIVRKYIIPVINYVCKCRYASTVIMCLWGIYNNIPEICGSSYELAQVIIENWASDWW